MNTDNNKYLVNRARKKFAEDCDVDGMSRK
jgi:hypothetical protein